MRLTVNGEPRELPAPAFVRDLVPEGSAGIAVALNGAVVPRGEHGRRELADEDVVEIVTATQGG